LIAIAGAETDEKYRNKKRNKYLSFDILLTERTRQSIGAIQGHLPALVSDDQGKPYIKALRGLVGS